MISREIWTDKHALVSFSKTSNSTRPSDSCYFEVFEKLTRACYASVNSSIAHPPPRATPGHLHFFFL
jgi:hypothetical protein